MLPIKNKGMFLEQIIEQTNELYLQKNLCLVSKISPNYGLTNTQTSQKIHFQKNFNCDYHGCYQGRYFEFEAKETSLKTFSLQNLRPNQIAKLDLVIKHQGIGFVLVYFHYFDKYFFVEWQKFQTYFQTKKKTIPFEWFLQNSIELILEFPIMIDYLSQINRLINCIS